MVERISSSGTHLGDTALRRSVRPTELSFFVGFDFFTNVFKRILLSFPPSTNIVKLF